MPDAAGSPSTARDRAAAQRLAAINMVAAAMHVAADVGDDLEGDYDISISDASEAAVDALCAHPEVLRALAGEAEPSPDACPDCERDRADGRWNLCPLHEIDGVPAGGSAPAAEVEQLKWERDMALSRVAAAEAVQVRMGDSLPDSGPWESWSERDRAVRDYEGDLSAALATETDTVGERLREVEGERDEARAEVDRLRGEASELLAKVTALVGQLDTVSAAGSAAITQLDVMHPVVEAAEAWQAWVSPADSLADPVVEGQARALYGAVSTYRAGGSAPHQGATTDGPTWDAYRAADRALTKWHERRHALLARLAAIESNDMSRRVMSGYLPAMISTAEVRALLGAGEPTEVDQ